MNSMGLRRIALGGLLIATASSAFGSSFDFEDSAQGWQQADFNPFSYEASVVGNATTVNGTLAGWDWGGYAFAVSADYAGQNFGSFYGGSFGYDYRAVVADGAEFPQSALIGNGEWIFQPETVTASQTFNRFEYVLSESAGWFYFNPIEGNVRVAAEADIRRVLENFHRIAISTDVRTGADENYIDNVDLVPEPATASMVLLGALGAMVRRKRRRS
jgi:hypothetical protein